MTTTIRPVTWFEIGSPDVEASKTFYGRLFGWTFETDGDGSYTMIKAGEGIGGGILGTHGDVPNYAVFYVEVPDVADHVPPGRRRGRQGPGRADVRARRPRVRPDPRPARQPPRPVLAAAGGLIDLRARWARHLAR